ncbi:MAG: hypothetical protein WB629_10765, partial [Candidatus Sulfotelmatobacter sp.]
MTDPLPTDHLRHCLRLAALVWTGEGARPHISLSLHKAVLNYCLLGEEVVEGFYGGEFVVFDVEDGVE